MTIEKLQEYISRLEEIKQLLEENQISDTNTVEEKAVKKYIEVENVKVVAEYINECGHRIAIAYSKQGKIDRRYTSNDISSIIKKNNIQNQELKQIALKIFYHNRRNGSWVFR